MNIYKVCWFNHWTSICQLNIDEISILGQISKILLPWSSRDGQTCPVEGQLQPVEIYYWLTTTDIDSKITHIESFVTKNFRNYLVFQLELYLDVILKIFKRQSFYAINHLVIHLCSVKLQTSLCITALAMLFTGNYLIHTSKPQILARTLDNLNSD